MPSQSLGNFVNRTTTSSGMTKILDSVSAFGRFNVSFPESILRARSLRLTEGGERNHARRLLYPLDYIFAVLHCQSTDEICYTRPFGDRHSLQCGVSFIRWQLTTDGRYRQPRWVCW